MKKEEFSEERALLGLAGFWYRLNLSIGEQAPVLVYFKEEDNWTGCNLVVCFDDEAPSEICHIAMARSEWAKLVSEKRIEMAWGLSGKPIELEAITTVLS